MSQTKRNEGEAEEVVEAGSLLKQKRIFFSISKEEEEVEESNWP
jgi:hypothetical protein